MMHDRLSEYARYLFYLREVLEADVLPDFPLRQAITPPEDW